MKKQKKEKSSMKEFWEAFKKFISRGNVVDMAVGVAVATAFTAIVSAFTGGFISPLLALLSGEASLAEFKWVLREAQFDLVDPTLIVKPEVAILWGAFVQKIIDFFIVAFVLFLVMRVAARISARAKKIAAEIKDEIPEVKEAKAKEAAEKAKKEEEEKLAAIEAEKKAKEEAEAKLREIEAVKARDEEEIRLLRDILAALQNK